MLNHSLIQTFREYIMFSIEKKFNVFNKKSYNDPLAVIQINFRNVQLYTIDIVYQ